MFRNRDSKGSRLQVVPTDDANWPQEDLKTGEPAPSDEAASGRPVPEAPAPSPGPAPAPTPEPAARAPAPAAHTTPVAARKPRVSGAAPRSPSASCWRPFSAAPAGTAIDWLTVGRFTVSTDDAYVQAYNATLAAKVAGYLSDVRVTDNARVRAGDVIATIDDGDYRLAVDSARDKVATQQATIGRIGHQIAAQQAAVEQAKAQLVSAKAAATRMQLELDRQEMLVVRQASPAARSSSRRRPTAIRRTPPSMARRPRIDSAAANVDVLKGQEQEADQYARRTQDRARQGRARPVVHRHPRAARRRDRQPRGADRRLRADRPAAGEPGAARRRSTSTPTSRRRSSRGCGQARPVAIAVDALPEHAIEGTIESFSPASGAVFSLLPPDNATGNFTKIVQRLPVRIRVPADVAREGLLRPGMSVVVSVNTKNSSAARRWRRASPVQSAATR